VKKIVSHRLRFGEFLADIVRFIN